MKYGNKKTVLDGISFDSKAEANRWCVLRMQERAGGLTDLRRQVVYILAPAVMLGGRKKPAMKYIADFVYIERAGSEIVEDVKGMITPLFRAKQHLMKHVHNIEIKVTK